MLFKRLKNIFSDNRQHAVKRHSLSKNLWRFMGHYIAQEKTVIGKMLIGELILAALISGSFWAIGQIAGDNVGTAILLGAAGLLIGRTVTEIMLGSVYAHKYTPRFANKIRKQLYNFTAGQSLAFFQNNHAGRIGNKIMDTGRSIRDMVSSTIGAVWFAAIFTAVNIGLMASNNIWLTLPMGLWLASYIGTMAYFLPDIKRLSAKSGDVFSRLSGHMHDVLTNFESVKMHDMEDAEMDKLNDKFNVHTKVMHDMLHKKWKMDFTINILNWFMVLGTGLVGLWLAHTGQTSWGVAIAMALPMALQATFQSGWIKDEMANIFENLGIAEEGMKTLAHDHEIRDAEDAEDLNVKTGKAAIAYDNVRFVYDGTDKSVIDGLNLHIPAGQKVGVVGTSGAGKSTITKLLLRAYDVTNGQITVAGQNVAEVTQGSLRRTIASVPQESQMFHRSVLDNIRYARPEAEIDEVIAAARLANAHDFIESLPEGYSTLVGERGTKLSGGQKQRISIARAILKDAPVLILDEATSALDSESETLIQEALETTMRGKTVIAIAHRLSTLRQMDRIIVMDKGRIVEDGTHNELIHIKDGHYAKLWSMQSGGFVADDPAGIEADDEMETARIAITHAKFQLNK